MPGQSTTTPVPTASEVAPTPADLMRAVVQHRYGSADVLEVQTTTRPSIEPSQVLIDVESGGIDRGTWHLMLGHPMMVRAAGFGLRAPKQPIPGLDVAGRVVEVGSDVDRFSVGDEVFGVAIGSFAEYAAAEADKLAHKPPNLSWEQAGVAAISGMTALQALTDVGRLEPGQSVLVMGASGGVGSYAVQIAKALGATVTGVASTAKLDFVRSLGADAVIDYTQDDPTDSRSAYDLVVDTGGLTPVRRLRRVLTRSGTLVIVGGEGGNRLTGGVERQARAVLLSAFVPQRLTAFISKEHHEPLERLAALMADAAVVPQVDRVVDLDGVADAMRDLEAGRVRGKVCVRV
jgi:NADPH:quinone reductase-like Zn-dependent oxidoreductase